MSEDMRGWAFAVFLLQGWWEGDGLLVRWGCGMKGKDPVTSAPDHLPAVHPRYSSPPLAPANTSHRWARLSSPSPRVQNTVCTAVHFHAASASDHLTEQTAVQTQSGLRKDGDVWALGTEKVEM